MKITDEIKNFVENECKKSTSKYGYEPYAFHFVPMVKYGLDLVDELGGDREIVEIACWLHDIGSIVHGRKNHHITGAKIAEKILKEFNYPKDKIEIVKKCILNHRGSVNTLRNSIEEKIVAEADTMSAFDNIPGIFKAAFIYENLDQGKAREAVVEKIKNKWKKLHFDNSRKILEPKYKAIMFLFKK